MPESLAWLALVALSDPLPPPIVETVSASRTQAIVTFEPGPARCGGTEVQPTRMVRPWPAGATIVGERGDQGDLRTVTISFRIDGTGRPLGVRRFSERHGLSVDTSDIVPAFTLWRFPAGAAQPRCEIMLRADALPIEVADRDTLLRYVALGHARLPGHHNAALDAAFDRVKPAGDCYEGDEPRLSLQAFPDFESIPQEPGNVSAVIFFYDIDGGGRPVNIRLAASDGNAELEKSAAAALERFRYHDGNRTGCTWSFYRGWADPVPAPLPPGEDDFRPAASRCEDLEDWKRLPKSFPDDYERRGIEGWAALGFDVAPWGELGNIRVLASEPSAAFGERAEAMLSGARLEPSATGYTGCTARLLFELPNEDDEVEISDPSVTIPED